MISYEKLSHESGLVAFIAQDPQKTMLHQKQEKKPTKSVRKYFNKTQQEKIPSKIQKTLK